MSPSLSAGDGDWPCPTLAPKGPTQGFELPINKERSELTSLPHLSSGVPGTGKHLLEELDLGSQGVLEARRAHGHSLLQRPTQMKGWGPLELMQLSAGSSTLHLPH